MKLLVATNETQGRRKNDFSHAWVGEIVFPGSRCSSGSVDDACGCYRSVVGIGSNKSTTTAKVVDSETTEAEWIALVAKNLHKGGWGTKAECATMARAALAQVKQGVAPMPVGTVVEIRDDVLVARS